MTTSTGGPRVILHAFSTFKLGGPQARFVQLANAFAGRYRHVIAAMDNCFDAGERLADDVLWERLPLKVVKGSALANRGSLREVLRQIRPDLLVTYNWGAIEWAAANVPRVVSHVHVEDGFGPEEARAQLPRRVWMRRVLLGWNRVPVLVASRNLERIARDTWHLSPGRVVFVPNGVDLIPPDAGRGTVSPEVRIGTVAGLRPEKNIARLIRAVARSSHRHRLHLTVVGDGPQRGELVALAKELGVIGQVVFAGYQKDPVPYLQRFDLFALSSDTEQLPLALLEALSLGMPAVATRVGDVGDVLGDVSPETLCDPADDAFERALETVLAQRSRWNEWAEKGRAKVASLYARSLMLSQWQRVFDGHVPTA